jgi:hypothetical protein
MNRIAITSTSFKAIAATSLSSVGYEPQVDVQENRFGPVLIADHC